VDDRRRQGERIDRLQERNHAEHMAALSRIAAACEAIAGALGHDTSG
jgi:hypothetical protein